jgi:hypothetical protein
MFGSSSQADVVDIGRRRSADREDDDSSPAGEPTPPLLVDTLDVPVPALDPSSVPPRLPADRGSIFRSMTVFVFGSGGDESESTPSRHAVPPCSSSDEL